MERKVFTSNGNKGFQIMFPYGLVASVQWGPGNYAKHEWTGDFPDTMSKEHEHWGSDECEIACYEHGSSKDSLLWSWGRWVSVRGFTDKGDDVKGYCDAETVVAFLDAVLELDRDYNPAKKDVDFTVYDDIPAIGMDVNTKEFPMDRSRYRQVDRLLKTVISDYLNTSLEGRLKLEAEETVSDYMSLLKDTIDELGKCLYYTDSQSLGKSSSNDDDGWITIATLKGEDAEKENKDK